jgi:hypothetical protein
VESRIYIPNTAKLVTSIGSLQVHLNGPPKAPNQNTVIVRKLSSVELRTGGLVMEEATSLSKAQRLAQSRFSNQHHVIDVSSSLQQ